MAALGIAAWLAITNRHLSAKLDRARADLDSAGRLLDAARQSARRGAEPEHAQAARAQSHAPATSPALRASMARLWDDSDWRAHRFDEAYLGVEARYGRFFQKLAGWSPERLEALKRQLANNELELLRAAMLGASDTDPKAAGDALRSAEARNRQQLQESLGEADYATFDASAKMEPYRESVGSIVNAMRAKNAQISGDAEESILGAYATAMQEAVRQGGPVDPRQLSEGPFADLKRRQADAFRIILMKKLSGVLDERQLRVFMEAEIEQGGGG